MIFEWSLQQMTTYVNSNQHIRILEKNEFGEVNTPLILIDELLDNLPPTVWPDPKLTWLDPAAGTGNFPIIIYQRLFTNLTSQFPIPLDRHNHIVEKMLFMIEINTNSTNKLIEIFGKNANIYNTNFLEYNLDKKYNIIIGNPPYQSSKIQTYIGSVGNKTLWDKFIVKSLDSLSIAGFLAFINPNSWRRPKSKLYEIMTKQNQLLFLHIYGKKDGQQLFGAQTRFDLYIIKNKCLPNYRIHLIDEKNTSYQDFDILSWPFLPNYNYDDIQRMIEPNKPTINVIFDSSKYDARKLSKNETPEYKYPIVHTITKKGLGIRWAKEPFINSPKILLNFNEQQYPYNDYLGKYGMSQLTFGLPIQSEEEGERIINIINSLNFKEIIKATKWTAFQTDYRMFNYFTTIL